MNAIETAIAEARYERRLESLQDAADAEAARHESRISAHASYMPVEFIKMSREKLMAYLYDVEFGGEYALADVVMSYSMWKVGAISNDEYMRRIDKTMQDACYAQAKWEVLE